MKTSTNLMMIKIKSLLLETRRMAEDNKKEIARLRGLVNKFNKIGSDTN